jgi:hypothetical protein
MVRINRVSAALLALVMGGLALGAGEDRDLQPVMPSGQLNITQDRDYYPGGRENGSFALSPDCQTAASSSRGPVMLFDLVKRKKNRQPRVLVAEDRNYFGITLAFSPDGKILAGMGNEQYGGQDPAVHFWDVASGKEVRQLDNDQAFFCLTFSPDGKLLALGGHGRIEVWDAASGDEVRVIPGQENALYHSVAFAPDGKSLATATGGLIQLWELATGKERHQYRLGHEEPEVLNLGLPPGLMMRNIDEGPMSASGGLAFSGDGKLLAAGGHDHSIHVWNLLADRELPPLIGHQSPPQALRFTADGKQLISLDSGGQRLAWNVGRILKSAPGKLARLSDADFDELWDDLAESDAFRAYRAVRHMAADPARALAMVEKHVKPVPAGDTKRLEKLVADLQGPNAGLRRKAMTEMRKLGEAALGALSDLSEEARQGTRALAILQMKLEAQYATPERQRALHAVDVLEQIGTPEARQALEKLAKGAAGTRLTKAAKGSLERLKESGDKAQAKQGNPEALWNDLAGDDAPAAYRAIRAFAAMPKEAMTIFRAKVKPVVAVDAKRIDQLIADLDSNEFAVREKATADLEKLGDAAKPALKKALEGDASLDTKKRINKLLELQQTGQAPSAKLLGTLRAIEALERLGTDDARQLLETLSKGASEAKLTRDAKDALQRMGKQPAMR